MKRAPEQHLELQAARLRLISSYFFANGLTRGSTDVIHLELLLDQEGRRPEFRQHVELSCSSFVGRRVEVAPGHPLAKRSRKAGPEVRASGGGEDQAAVVPHSCRGL